MRTSSVLLGALCLALPAIGQSAVLGSMTPARPLNDARVAALPAEQRAPWQAYLARSRALMAADKAALAAERFEAAGFPARPKATGDNGMPLRRPAAWYATPEAWRVVRNILSFQTPAGGWGKNIDRGGPPRAPGEPYVPPDEGKNTPLRWNYVGTIDNGATTTELRFLARVQAQVGGAQADSCRAAFFKGLGYLLAAQYPNGGYPQVYPLQGGYHDAVTLNDDAMVRVASLLLEVADGQGELAFVPAALRREAQEAAARAVALFVATQHSAGGKRTGWGQQYDALTLELAGARNFEPAALASPETASVLMLLMQLPQPSPAVRDAVPAGVAWLQAVALRDLAWTADPPEAGRRLLPKQGAGPIWSRYYDARSMRPVFGDRDRSIHDDVNELGAERRNGYAWFGAAPERALARYAAWSQAAVALGAARQAGMAPAGEETTP